jgi:hypothetical protein
MNEQYVGSFSPIEIDVLTNFLNELGSLSQDLVQHLKSGQKLCHYTSLEGALGIIGGHDVWLTNSRYSNDDEELSYGHRLVDEVLGEMTERTSGTIHQQPWLNRLMQRAAEARNDHVYICCFCEHANLLSQWRGYADNGGGVCIEFDPEGFTEFTGHDSQFGLMRLWRVFYDLTQQQEIVRKCIEYHWPGSEDERIDYIVGALQFFIPTFKNRDFREEQERRLIFTPIRQAPVQPKFRTRNGLLVPYFGLKDLYQAALHGSAFRLPIKDVLIGPGKHRDLNMQSMELMLAANNYSDVSVTASSTPFRGA